MLSLHRASQPVHIDLLTDDDGEPDGEDKPVAETARKRPARAAAVAAQTLSHRLAGLKGALSRALCLRCRR